MRLSARTARSCSKSDITSSRSGTPPLANMGLRLDEGAGQLVQPDDRSGLTMATGNRADRTSPGFAQTFFCGNDGTVPSKYDPVVKAETTIGLYKTEPGRKDLTFRRGPLHRLADVELLTADPGRLVQHQPSPAPPLPRTTCGVRGSPLRATGSRKDGSTPVTRLCTKPVAAQTIHVNEDRRRFTKQDQT